MSKYEVRPYVVDSESVLVRASSDGKYAEYKSVDVTPYQSGYGVFATEDNRCVFTTGRGMPDDESLAKCTAHLIERLAGEQMVALSLDNGMLISVHANIAAEVRGIDVNGHVLVSGGGDSMYALTKCCQASATASMGAVCCRACYEEIDEYLGGIFTDSDLAARVA